MSRLEEALARLERAVARLETACVNVAGDTTAAVPDRSETARRRLGVANDAAAASEGALAEGGTRAEERGVE
jgi:hypothetical protein